MPFWDRHIDLVVVPRADTRSLNGLLAVIDRYHVGQIVSVEIGDSRAGREWLDAVAARQIGRLDTGSTIGLEDGLAVALDGNGWVRIDAGATSAGIGAPGSASGVDVLVLDKVSDEARAWLQSAQPSIVVAPEPIDAPGGSVVVDARENAIELIFDGAQWEVKALP